MHARRTDALVTVGSARVHAAYECCITLLPGSSTCSLSLRTQKLAERWRIAPVFSEELLANEGIKRKTGLSGIQA
jgi:hypothetical protein